MYSKENECNATWNLVRRSRITLQRRRHDQNSNFRKIKMADGRRPPSWKWFYRNITAGNHPNSMKFGLQTQMLIRRTVTWQTIEILQIQNGWRPPYWKSLLAISQRFIVRLTRNLVWRCRITLRHRSHWQNTRPSFCLCVIICRPTDLVGALS